MSQTTTLAKGIFEAISSNDYTSITEFKAFLNSANLKEVIAYFFKYYVTYSEALIFLFFEKCLALDYQDWLDIFRIIEANLEKQANFAMQAFLCVSYSWLGINMFCEYAKVEDGINKKTRKYFLRLFGATLIFLDIEDSFKKYRLTEYDLTPLDLQKLTEKLVSQGAIPALPVLKKIVNNEVILYLEGDPPKGWEWVKDYPVKKRK